jgi:hypothetical protein
MQFLKAVCLPVDVSEKSKVTFSLCFNRAPRHEGVLGEWRYSTTHSLTSAQVGGEWSASRPGRFTPRERAPDTHWIGGWVVPRAVLDTVVKKKIPSPRRESNPRTQIGQPVAQRYTDWAIPTLIENKKRKIIVKHQRLDLLGGVGGGLVFFSFCSLFIVLLLPLCQSTYIENG